MPVKAPSIQKLVALAKSKGCRIRVYQLYGGDFDYRFAIWDAEDKCVFLVYSNTAFKDYELRRGIEGFLNAL